MYIILTFLNYVCIRLFKVIFDRFRFYDIHLTWLQLKDQNYNITLKHSVISTPLLILLCVLKGHVKNVDK